jgi:hypothetical protein
VYGSPGESLLGDSVGNGNTFRCCILLESNVDVSLYHPVMT